MNKSTKRVVGWGAGMGIGAALLVLIAVLVMILTAEPAAHTQADDVQAVEAQAGEETALVSEEAPACDYPAQWIGQPVDEAAVKEAFKSYRILKPDQPATMDYHAERRNVMIDDNGIVTEVRCG